MGVLRNSRVVRPHHEDNNPIAFLFSVVTLAARPAAPQLGRADLGFDGTWEGKSYTYYRDMVTGSPMDLREAPTDIRVIIKRSPTEFLTKNDKGEWESSGASLLQKVRFQSAPGTLVGSLLNEGQDNDGAWVEHQDFYFTKKDPSTVLFYWLRAVNNLDLSVGKAQSKWSVFKVAELHKVQ